MECILLGIFYGSWELSHALIHLISWTNTSPSQVEGKNFPFFVLVPFLFYSGGRYIFSFSQFRTAAKGSKSRKNTSPVPPNLA